MSRPHFRKGALRPHYYDWDVLNKILTVCLLLHLVCMWVCVLVFVQAGLYNANTTCVYGTHKSKSLHCFVFAYFQGIIVLWCIKNTLHMHSQILASHGSAFLSGAVKGAFENVQCWYDTLMLSRSKWLKHWACIYYILLYSDKTW